MPRWLTGILCVVCVACSDSAGPDPLQIPGSYTLQTINGQQLPFFLVTLPGFVITQTAGSIRLNQDDTYREEYRLRYAINDENGVTEITDTTVVFVGTYEAEDSVVLLTSNPEGLISFGFVSANRLTLSFESGDSLFTYVYRRN
jgi:hypothetical protein